MHHFVHENVHQTGTGLLRQFEIEPDAFGFNITGAPECFHFLDSHVFDGHAQLRSPFGDERRQLIAEVAAILAVKHRFPRLSVRVRANT